MLKLIKNLTLKNVKGHFSPYIFGRNDYSTAFDIK